MQAVVEKNKTSDCETESSQNSPMTGYPVIQENLYMMHKQ